MPADPVQKKARHLSRSLELQPVPGALDLQAVLPDHTPVRQMRRSRAQRRVLVAPDELGRDGDPVRRGRERLLCGAAKVDTVVVEPSEDVSVKDASVKE